MSNDQMQPLTEHLDELRRRIIWIVLSFIAALVVSFIYSIDIFHWIRDYAFNRFTVFSRSPGDPIRVYMQISFILSFILISPIILYHIWQFVRPGLHPKEQKAALMYIPAAVFLFLLGLSFGFFVIFPYMLQFMNVLNKQMGIEPLYGVGDAFSFLFNIIFPLALFFELPVLVLFLTRIRILKPDYLRKARRVAYLLLVILAAVITPPDIVSNILVSIPLILLYEISIWISTVLYRRLEREDQEREKEWEEGLK